MIAKLKGLLDSVAAGSCIIDVNGVGYLVFASGRTLGRVGQPGSAVSLLIETHVREDHIHLYGFSDRAERDWFSLLTTVQGVGAKVALAILTVSDPERLTLAIGAQDKAPLVQADGVGPKLAGRILSELKDKVEPISGALAMAASVQEMPAPTSAPGPAGDAVSALVNLGYGRSEAFQAIAKAQQTAEGADLGTLIRLGLKELGG